MKIREIGDFVSLRQGLAINKATEYLISDTNCGKFTLPLLRIADMIENKFTKFVSTDVNSNVIAKTSDIIYTRTGQIGLAFRGFKGVVHNNSFIVSLISDEIDEDFLFTVLQADFFRKQALSLAKNSVQPDLTHAMFKSIKIPVFPIVQQKFIAKIYLLLIKKIKINNQINTQLEELAKTIYDYWFLQFEFPNEEGKPYKSSGGKMVYNEQLKREIPEGWEVSNLMNNKFCHDIKAGVDYFKCKNYLPTSNVDAENITDGEFVSFEQRESRANMQPKKYSVWFAKMKNSVKHLSIPYNSEWFISKYILSTGFQGLQCNEKTFAYIHCVINSSWFENYKDMLSHGATQESVNNEDLKNIYFVCPSDKVLNKFNKISLPILEKKFSLIKENQELSSLRDFLLPLLMNGQVTFKDENEEVENKVEKFVSPKRFDKFNQWKQMQGYAARGEADDEILKKIYDAMDEDDKK